MLSPVTLCQFYRNIRRRRLIVARHLVFGNSSPETVVLITPRTFMWAVQFHQLALAVPFVIGADGAEAGFGFCFGFQPAQLVIFVGRVAEPHRSAVVLFNAITAVVRRLRRILSETVGLGDGFLRQVKLRVVMIVFVAPNVVDNRCNLPVRVVPVFGFAPFVVLCLRQVKRFVVLPLAADLRAGYRVGVVRLVVV